MSEIDYKMGMIESKVEDLSKDMTEVKEDIKGIKDDLQSINAKMDGWHNRAVGAVGILSLIGSIGLWLSDSIITVIRTKLGF